MTGTAQRHEKKERVGSGCEREGKGRSDIVVCREGMKEEEREER